METEITSELDFAGRLRRSRGRSGRTFVASAKVTKAELTELETTAAEAGKALSEWARETLLSEARRSETDPVWTEIVANRMLLMGILRPLATGQTMTAQRFDELVAAIKAGKRSMAEEVMRQYKPVAPKEQTHGN